MGVEAIKARKPAGPLSFQLLPTISVDDDVYAESGAMLRYPRKLGGVYLNREKAAMKVDMILDALETVILEIFKTGSKEGRETFWKEMVLRYVGAIDKMKAKEKGLYLLGEQLSTAYLKLLAVVIGLNSGDKSTTCPVGF